MNKQLLKEIQILLDDPALCPACKKDLKETKGGFHCLECGWNLIKSYPFRKEER